MLAQDAALPAAAAADVLEERDEHAHLHRHICFEIKLY